MVTGPVSHKLEANKVLLTRLQQKQALTWLCMESACASLDSSCCSSCCSLTYWRCRAVDASSCCCSLLLCHSATARSVAAAVNRELRTAAARPAALLSLPVQQAPRLLLPSPACCRSGDKSALSYSPPAGFAATGRVLCCCRWPAAAPAGLLCALTACALAVGAAATRECAELAWVLTRL